MQEPEKLSRDPHTCFCKPEVDFRESVNHLLWLDKGGGKKFHSISILEVDEGRYRVDSCRYKNNKTISTLIGDTNVIEPYRVSQQGAAVIIQEFCCPPECLSSKVSGRYSYNSTNKEYFDKNGVTCPRCGKVPEKYEDGEFYHNYCEEGMYSCSIKPFIVEWILNPDVVSNYLQDSFSITEYRGNEDGSWFPKSNSSGDRAKSREIERLEAELSSARNKLKEADADKINKIKEELSEKKNNLKEVQSKLSEKEEKIEKLEREKEKMISASDTSQVFVSQSDVSFEEKAPSELKSKIQNLQSNTLGNSYVYVIVVMKNSEPHYYVGKSNNPTNRIKSHIKNKNVVDVERVEGCSSEEDALERERELAYEIAIEKGTTNILGGK